MQSAIYRGTVRHSRHSPTQHRFSYQVFMLYLDLSELDRVFDGSCLWSSGRPAPAWFRRQDYLPGPASLDTAVRDLVEQRLGQRPDGPVRLLTNLRYFGYLQNPISCYYCFDRSGEAVEAVVLEVTNTPWKERISYVLRCDPGTDRQRIGFDKGMHVSPFMPMAMRYQWIGDKPGTGLRMHLENHIDGEKVFGASLTLERQPISPQSLRATLLRYPFMTLKVVAAIYWQAMKLYVFKRVGFYPNPHTRS